MSRSTGRLRLMMPVVTDPQERQAVEDYCERLLAELKALEAEAARVKAEAFQAIGEMGRWARGMKA